MSRAALSLGSNLGDPRAHLDRALAHLAPWTTAVSPWFRTAPWGGVEQGDFLNVVALVADPDAEPRTWLGRARDCERDAARVRDVRWGPRTLDVDVLAVVDDGGEPVVSADPELTLPHPRAHERAFVLVPWAEVDPDAVLAGWGRVAALRDALPAGEVGGVHRVDAGGAAP